MRIVSRLHLFELFVLSYFGLFAVADTADINTALSTPYGEDAGRSRDGDSESGNGVDERRTTAPGRRGLSDGRNRSCFLVSTSLASETRRPAGTRCRTIEQPATTSQATSLRPQRCRDDEVAHRPSFRRRPHRPGAVGGPAGRPRTESDAKPGDTLTSAARLRPSPQMVDA